MRKNVIKVVEAFKLGKKAQGDSKRTIWTDGFNVYSYNMLIAKKFNDGGKPMYVVIDREYGPSNTTRSKIDGLQFLLRDENLHIVREHSILTWDFKFNVSY